jgi:phage terminase Nu1 subunit (DNA packaging protein)
MPVGTVELVTMAEYARRRGCTEGAVRRAVKSGRIALIDGRLDPVAADVQWARNTRVRAGSRPADADHLRLPGASTQAGSASERDADREDPDAYWVVKARRERAEADIAELKLAELRGELVRASAVRSALSKRASAMRESLLQLPARVVPLLVADPSAESMDRLLRAEIVAALNHLHEA